MSDENSVTKFERKQDRVVLLYLARRPFLADILLFARFQLF